MKIIKTVQEMQAFSRAVRTDGRSIGFVPTMGALHDGHLDLVDRAGKDNAVSVVSIFVNPTQFGPGEDFEKYPRQHDSDLEKLSALNVDAVFMPEPGEMYPGGYAVSIDIGALGTVLCGASRPGHFNGVATVVAKLFNMVMPDRAYFGQKDYQQTVVIKTLVRDLNFGIEIVVCPIVREQDGLAMSSRNAYMNEEERRAALVLFRALGLGSELVLAKKERNGSAVVHAMKECIRAEPLAEIDYAAVVHPDTLEPMTDVILPAVLCLAVNIGNTRLIDNIIIPNSSH